MGHASDMQIGLVSGYALNMLLKADGDAATAPGLSAHKGRGWERISGAQEGALTGSG